MQQFGKSLASTHVLHRLVGETSQLLSSRSDPRFVQLTLRESDSLESRVDKHRDIQLRDPTLRARPGLLELRALEAQLVGRHRHNGGVHLQNKTRVCQ
jgi:hypothetical protein